MPDYDFSTINDKEFEELACDLLNAGFNFGLQSFKSGQDKGIDLRWSSPDNKNSLVVQAKHYRRSGFSSLLSVLKADELKKIRKLKPDRYILVTSVPLSPQQKDTLWFTLKPFVQTPNDIFGPEDLNRLLGSHEAIEKRHFKLWFSSVSLLSRLLNNAIEGRSRYLIERIIKRFPSYVLTERLDEANKILEKQKLLLITGQPGIGKTTLAEIMILERMRMGFEVFEILTVREGEDVMSIDPDRKQIFYMDDFLGDIHMEIVSGRRSDSELSLFIDRVRNSPNKYILLTSRTVVLQKAMEKFEKLRRSKLKDDRIELELDDYTEFQRAEILYNHVYFSPSGEALSKAILKSKFYWKVLEHDNFAPRLIEVITDAGRISGMSISEFQEFAEDTLENPSEIWRLSFLNEIGYWERCFLYTLFTFWMAQPAKFPAAFMARLQYEKDQNNRILSSHQFTESAKALSGSFILISRGETDNDSVYEFINPSLADFLDSELAESPDELKAILSSAVFAEQLHRFRSGNTSLSQELQLVLLERITSGKLDSRTYLKQPNHLTKAEALKLLCEFCPEIPLDVAIYDLMIEMDLDGWYDLDEVLYFIADRPERLPRAYDYIDQNFDEIIGQIITGTDSDADPEEFIQLFERWKKNLVTYSQGWDGSAYLNNFIDEAMQSSLQLIQNRSSDFEDVDDVKEQFENLERRFTSLKEAIFPQTPWAVNYSLPQYDEAYWSLKTEENYRRLQEESDVEDHYNDPQHEDDLKPAIDDLFSLLRDLR
jgi:hypothetical protein